MERQHPAAAGTAASAGGGPGSCWVATDRRLAPGDRWCVVAARWLQSYAAGVAAPVVLAATNAAVLEIVPLRYLRACSVDIPDDPSSLLG